MLYLIVSNSPNRIVLDHTDDEVTANLMAFEQMIDGVNDVRVETLIEAEEAV